MGIATLQPMGQGRLRKDLWQTKNTQEESCDRIGSQDRRDRLGDAARRKRLGAQADDPGHRVIRKDVTGSQRITAEHET